MRFSTTLILTSLLASFHLFVLANVTARPSKWHHDQLEKPVQAIQSRQHHVKKDLIDLCLSTDALAVLGLPGILDPLLAGLNLCLCIHDLNIFLESHVGALLANLLGGKSVLLTRLDLLINTSPHSQECHYPSHSSAHCTAHNPCGYTCDPPYVPGTIDGHPACVCPPPLVDCNGKCSRTCGTSLPKKRSPKVIATLLQAKSTCKSHETVCGIPGHKNTPAFECIDLATAVDSCGGCIVPAPFVDSTLSSSGVDCSHLPGVAMASCSASRCHIVRCKEGWAANSDSTLCVHTPGAGTRMKKLPRDGLLLPKLSIAIGSELSVWIESLAGLVVDLQECPITPPGSSSPSIPPASQSLLDGSLINTIVVATGNVLFAADVDTLVKYVNVLVQINANALDVIDGCNCAGILGLGPLLANLGRVIDTTLAVQTGLGQYHSANPPAHTLPFNTQSTPPPPHSAHTSTRHTQHPHSLRPTSTTYHDLHATVTPGSGALLSEQLGLGPVGDTFEDLNSGLLNLPVVADIGLVLGGDAGIQLDAIVGLVVDLYNLTLSLDGLQSTTPRQTPSGTNITGNLLASLYATANATLALLDSTGGANFVVNIPTLLDAISLSLEAINACGCSGVLNLQAIVALLEDLATAALNLQSWCSKHLIGPRSLAAASPEEPVVTSLDDEIVVGLDDLFSLLNLKAVKVRVGLKGLTGPRLSQTINGYLNELRIGPANSHVKRIPTSRSEQPPARSKSTKTSKVNPALIADVKALVYLAMDLGQACESSSLPHGSPSPPSQVIPGTTLIDAGLIAAVLVKTDLLLTANTVASLLASVDAVVDVATAVQNTLSGCGCVDSLGLGEIVANLDAVVDAALGLQAWLALNPVLVNIGLTPHYQSSTHPHETSVQDGPHHTHGLHSSTASHVTITSVPSPISTPQVPSTPIPTNPNITLGLPIDLGLVETLGGLLAELEVNLGVVLSGNAVAQLGSLVDGVVRLVIGFTDQIPAGAALSALPSTYPTSFNASATISHFPPPSQTQLVQPALIDQLLGLTGQLVSSVNVSTLAANAAILLDLNVALSTSLLGCGCVDTLGLDGLVKDTEALTAQLLAILGWCAENGAAGSGPGVESEAIPIILDTSHLLTALGLNHVAQVDGVVDGLGDEINKPVNGILHALGLGGIRL